MVENVEGLLLGEGALLSEPGAEGGVREVLEGDEVLVLELALAEVA